MNFLISNCYEILVQQETRYFVKILIESTSYIKNYVLFIKLHPRLF